MLDCSRLEKNALLIESGWSTSHTGQLKKHLEKWEHLNKRLEHPKPYLLPQVPSQEIFQQAWDIVDTLDGICIKNQCPELGVGESTDAIEFDFFHYDSYVYEELQRIRLKIGKPVIYIGIGYAIAGDWLVDETGIIYFQNCLTDTLFPFSKDIYTFLEKDIYGYTDLYGKNIF